MTARRNDITELELLALVEGEHDALTPERREALLADSMVVRLVAKLSADRNQLAALPQIERAPAGLVATAIERSEREALAALAAAEPATGAQLRSSTTVVERPSVLAKLFQTNWPARFAAAAGLGLAALGVYFTATALIDWNATKPVPVAINPPKPTPSPALPDSTFPSPTPIGIAAAPDAAPIPIAPTSVAIANGPIDTATAVSLVPERRVVLVLHAPDPQKALTALGIAAQRRAGASAWQPLVTGTPEFAGALAAATASGFDVAGSLTPPAIALVSLGASTSSFESLIATLRTETDASIPSLSPQWAAVDGAALKATHDRASLLALQPHRVLWWEQGSAAWTPPVVIPVVILPSK